MNGFSLGHAALSVMKNAKNPMDIQNYSSFAMIMSHYRFTWEPVKIETEDGFTVTLFHVTGHYDITEDEQIVPVP